MRTFLHAVALVGAVSLTACAGPTPLDAPGRAASVTEAKVAAGSDLGELEQLGFDLDESVLIEVAADGRRLRIGPDGVDFTGGDFTGGDFTGDAEQDSTMMSLTAAPAREANRVLIEAPAWKRGAGETHCVGDTAGGALTLTPCAGTPEQVWEIRPGGGSAQFELIGLHGLLRVGDSGITANGNGLSGLQTTPFAG